MSSFPKLQEKMTQTNADANLDRVELLRNVIIDELQKQYEKQVTDLQLAFNNNLDQLSLTKEELGSKYEKFTHPVDAGSSITTSKTKTKIQSCLPSNEVQLNIGEVLRRESGDALEKEKE